MSQVLSELNRGQDVHAVDAALKRHEAISADIQAGESRIQVVRDIVRELAHEKFHDVDTFRERYVHMCVYPLRRYMHCIKGEGVS